MSSILASRFGLGGSTRQFLRFVIVGVLNVVVSSIVFYIMYNKIVAGPNGIVEHLLRHPSDSTAPLVANGRAIRGVVSSVVAYCAGMVNSFLLNRAWTFGVKEYAGHHLPRFVILNLLGMGICSGAIYLLVGKLNVPYLPTWVAAVSMVTGLNFLGNKYWTFAEHRSGPRQPDR